MPAIFYAIVALILSEYVMRYFNWILRIVLFLALLGFAFKNKQQVTLSYFFGFEWETPLVVVLLIFFFAGAAVGMLAVFANVLHKRREIAALKRDIMTKNKLAEISETPQETR